MYIIYILIFIVYWILCFIHLRDSGRMLGFILAHHEIIEISPKTMEFMLGQFCFDSFIVLRSSP